MTEDLVELVADHYATSALPDRLHDAVAVTDCVIGDPSSLALRSEDLRSGLTADELAELVLTVAVAHGFSKAAIAWGPPPDMPVIEVPTPSPQGSVT